MAETAMDAATDPRAGANATRTVRTLLLELTMRLAGSVVEAPDAEARELLSALLGVQRSWPSLNYDQPIDNAWRDLAIALALAAEGQLDRVVAPDVSLAPLAVARRNAELLRGTLRSTVEFRQGCLLEPLADVQARLIVSNPPYIANR